MRIARILLALAVFGLMGGDAPVNKQAVQQVEAQPVSNIEQPQPEPVEEPEQPVKPAEPTPPAPSVASTHPIGCENYRELVAKYDWDVNLMLAVAMAESSCNPAAKGDTTLTFMQNGSIYGYSLGLFQVRILPGREQCNTIEPQVNVECAYNIYKRQGYAAWSVYNNGAYRKYL